MDIRTATTNDAPAIAAIYAPIVRETAISFKLEPPTIDEMGMRIATTLQRFPWLVSLDASGEVSGSALVAMNKVRRTQMRVSPGGAYVEVCGKVPAWAASPGCIAAGSLVARVMLYCASNSYKSFDPGA